MHHRARPLLVFSQGFAQPVQAYDTLLTDWASAGFVVAAPTYPHTQPPTTAGDPTPATPPLLTRRDIVHHPADLSAVIDSVVSESRDGASPLKGLVDASEIGLVGQSDGGNVSLAVADDSCCRLGSVRAVAVLSGAEMATFGGQYFPPGTTSPHSPPLLVAQGDDDTINPPACSAQIYDAAPQPKYFLDLLGATHLDPYTQPSPYESIVATVTTDFFDAELAHQRPAVTAMSTDGNVAGAAELVDGPTAPTAPGDCPGAPAEAP